MTKKDHLRLHFLGKSKTEEAKRNMSKAADHKGKKNSMYGKHHSEETKRKISEANRKTGVKPVRCIETGIEYYSVSDAKRKTGINHIGYLIKTGKGTKGFHWEWIKW